MNGQVDLLDVARRQWPTIAAGLVVGLIVGLGLSLLRTPIAEAQAELFVGPVDVPAEAVAGFVVATDALATTYAELASSTDVISAAADSAGVSSDVLSAATTAEAVPESPLIRVTAADTDPQRAESMAGALASQLQQYVEASRSEEGDTRKMRRQLAKVSRRLEAAKLQHDRSRAVFDSATAGAESDETLAQLRTKLTDGAGKIALLELEQETLRDSIVAARVDARTQIALRVVSDARVVGTDQANMRRNLVAAGAVIGLVIGFVLAVSREGRRRRRSLARRRVDQRMPPAQNAFDEDQTLVSAPRPNGTDPRRSYELDRW